MDSNVNRALFHRDFLLPWRQVFQREYTLEPQRQLIFIVGLLLTGLCYFFFDQAWLDSTRLWWNTSSALMGTCSSIGKWGDFFPYNVTLFALLLVAAGMRKSRYFRRLAMASLISAALAGGVALIGKNTFARPRPKIVLQGKDSSPYHLRGPRQAPGWQSLPSGHTATAMGAAIPLVVAVPEIGLPVLLLSLCISGSRMAGLYHYPSDLFAGATIGLFFGIRCGAPLRRWRQKARCLRERLRSPGLRLPAPAIQKS